MEKIPEQTTFKQVRYMKKIKSFIALMLFAVTTLNLKADENAKVIPAPLLGLDNFFTHHILIAEKSTHLLHLYKNNNGVPEFIKSYQMVTGKKTGDKSSEGDLRTPEGIYYFVDFMTHQQLLSKSGPQGIIYGAGAFVTNYPNPADERMGKGGSGIWLHSTNDETRIDKGLDSKGCVVTANNDLIEVSKYIELNKTPIVVVQDLVYLSEKTHQTKKQEIQKTIDSWLTAWRNKDINAYISYYHPQEFIDAKGNYAKYKSYKANVFLNPGKPKIDLENFSFLESKNYAIVTFTQKYQSSTINDTGKKILYLKQDDSYNWKIINEVWTSQGTDGLSEKIAFSPSMRFFKEGQGIEISKKDN
jgi:murein L,D-transpeptidase YafK